MRILEGVSTVVQLGKSILTSQCTLKLIAFPLAGGLLARLCKVSMKPEQFKI